MICSVFGEGGGVPVGAVERGGRFVLCDECRGGGEIWGYRVICAGRLLPIVSLVRGDRFLSFPLCYCFGLSLVRGDRFPWFSLCPRYVDHASRRFLCTW